MNNLKKGLMWSGIERFSVQGFQFILSLIIARLVGPRDFGLIAMLTIFISVAQVFTDSGFGNALIQKKNRTEVDYTTVFYFNISISTILYIVMYFCAPLIASFYREPVLSSVTRWISLNLIISSFCIIQRTRCRINSDFKTIAIVSFVAVVISGLLGLFFAFRGKGVWALVIQSVSFQLVQAILFWTVSKWHPVFTFSVESFKTLFNFGSKILASGLLHTLYMNLYSLVIGRFYNASDVGYYNRASTICQYIPTNLISIIVNVVYPLQCEHQDDNEWLINSFARYLRITAFIVFPIMIYISIMSSSLVNIILSEQWTASSPLISILSIAYMFLVISTLNNHIINAKGRSDLYFKAEVIKKIIAIVILIITLPFGVIILSLGLLLYYLIDTLVICKYTNNILGVGFLWQVKQLYPLVGVCLCAVLPTIMVNYLINTYWISLIIGSFIYWGVFLIVNYLNRNSEMLIIIGLIKKLFNMNSNNG